jgi:AcrR family transcriptional regulator
MSPKAPDPAVRKALVEAAAKVLGEEGPEALTTRRLATEVGTSTMAVYTYFEGMDELRRALALEGFERLAGYLAELEPVDDTVEHITALGGVYFFNALANYHLYRFMFVEFHPETEEEIGLSTFETLIEAVRKAIVAGRFAQADAEELATQLWVMSHGIVTLHMANCMQLDEAVRTLANMALNLFVAFGDDREAALASIEAGSQKVFAHLAAEAERLGIEMAALG